MDAEYFYVWVSHLENGGLAAASWPVAGMILPLAHTGEDQARGMEPYARKVAAARGLPVELVRFKRDTVLVSIEP